MAVIDSDIFLTHLVWTGLVDKATCGELKEAIELCTVKDIYTKDDMVAMLTEILTDFDNQIEPNSTRIDCESIIEQKIQALEGKSDGEK